MFLVQPMKLPAIIISDPHFTASPNDEYRWSLWPWLAGELVAEKARTLLILGDLTDAKDYHSAELVNRLSTAITGMPVEEIIILAGNHDWLKQGGVFFKFLQLVQKPKIRVITEITEDLGDDSDPTCIFLPYTKMPARDWKDHDFSHYDYLFMHQTAPGSMASNGQIMDGDEMPALDAGKVYSGDIHVPQKIGVIEYVGSPYHVHFGDDFKPRCVAIDRKRRSFDLHFETISRRAIKVSSLAQLKRIKLGPNDQVKITLEVMASEAPKWNQVRREAMEWVRSKGAQVHGLKLKIIPPDARLGVESPRVGSLDPEYAIYSYVVDQELGGDALDAGLEIIK